jgi:hypothetical protein
VVASRAPDFFDPAAAQLLQSFCQLSAVAEVQLHHLSVDPLNAEVHVLAVKTAAQVSSLAVRLRLAPSSAWSAKAGILDERAPGQDSEHELLHGGNIVRF